MPSLGGVGTLARARHLARAGGEVPRPRRQHGPDRVRRPRRRRAVARGRRRLGVGRRRRRGQPGGADRQAARPHGDRQRRLAGQGPLSCSTSSASTPRSTTTTALSSTGCARPLRTASTSTSTASAATTCRPRWPRCARGAGSRCAARSPSTRARSRSPARQPLPGRRQQPHAARLPRQRVPASLPGGAARARRLPGRGPARLPRDDRRRARARARGADPHARRATPPARPSCGFEAQSAWRPLRPPGASLQSDARRTASARDFMPPCAD